MTLSFPSLGDNLQPATDFILDEGASLYASVVSEQSTDEVLGAAMSNRSLKRELRPITMRPQRKKILSNPFCSVIFGW